MQSAFFHCKQATFPFTNNNVIAPWRCVNCNSNHTSIFSICSTWRVSAEAFAHQFPYVLSGRLKMLDMNMTDQTAWHENRSWNCTTWQNKTNFVLKCAHVVTLAMLLRLMNCCFIIIIIVLLWKAVHKAWRNAKRLRYNNDYESIS